MKERNESPKEQNKIVVVTRIDLPKNNLTLLREFSRHFFKLKKETNSSNGKVRGLIRSEVKIGEGAGWTVQVWDSRESMMGLLKIIKVIEKPFGSQGKTISQHFPPHGIVKKFLILI